MRDRTIAYVAALGTQQLDDELHQGDVDDDHKERRSDEGREDQLA